MKKFFTIIALSAMTLSLSSFDTIETDTPCTDQWVQNVNALEKAGFGTQTSMAIADLDFETCLDETYGPAE